MKVLVVVDCQNDFIDGSLANEEAQKRLPKIIEKINKEKENGSLIICTRDTHGENYLSTLEGKKLPIPHCIENTRGWELNEEIKKAIPSNAIILNKKTFGSRELVDFFRYNRKFCNTIINSEEVEIEICGFVTSICVVSNALLLRTFFPNTKITVDMNCCAGLTKEDHRAAAIVMRNCQIDLIGED